MEQNAGPSSLLSSFQIKPYKSEAIQRIRSNALGLIAALVLSYLLPVPSLPTALSTFLSTSNSITWTKAWILEWFCVLEVIVVTVMGYNIIEAFYAIKYPRAPLPPLVSPSKPRKSTASLITPKKPKVLSPNTSPQTQRPFSFSSSSSTISSGAVGVGASRSSPIYNGSTNTTSGPHSASVNSTLNAAKYAQSPLSTPSRVLHYNIPPSSTNSMGSSISPSEYLATPSPVISAYKGKHAAMEVGRALDGLYLSRIRPDNSMEE